MPAAFSDHFRAAAASEFFSPLIRASFVFQASITIDRIGPDREDSALTDAFRRSLVALIGRHSRSIYALDE